MNSAQVARLAAAPEFHRRIGGDLPLDRWIGYAVKVLRDAGVETFESCEGGRGHAFPKPTIRFHGQSGEGFRAFAAARVVGLPVYALRRSWSIIDGEVTGPYWEIVFHPLSKLIEMQRDAEKSGLLK